MVDLGLSIPALAVRAARSAEPPPPIGDVPEDAMLAENGLPILDQNSDFILGG